MKYKKDKESVSENDPWKKERAIFEFQTGSVVIENMNKICIHPHDTNSWTWMMISEWVKKEEIGLQLQ